MKLQSSERENRNKHAVCVQDICNIFWGPMQGTKTTEMDTWIPGPMQGTKTTEMDTWIPGPMQGTKTTEMDTWIPGSMQGTKTTEMDTWIPDPRIHVDNRRVKWVHKLGPKLQAVILAGKTQPGLGTGFVQIELTVCIVYQKQLSQATLCCW